MEMAPLIHDFALAITELPPAQAMPRSSLPLFFGGLCSSVRILSRQFALERVQYLGDMIVELRSGKSGHGGERWIAIGRAPPCFQDTSPPRNHVRSQRG